MLLAKIERIVSVQQNLEALVIYIDDMMETIDNLPDSQNCLEHRLPPLA
jgi:hypothetical protein